MSDTSSTLARLAVSLALDDSNFTTGMKDLNAQMTVTDSQFKTSVAGFKDWGTTLDGMQAYAINLSEKISIQEQIVSKWKDQLASAKTVLAENASTVTSLKTQINDATTAYEKSRTEVGDEDSATQKLKDDLEKLNLQYTDSEKAVIKNSSAVNDYQLKLNTASGKLKTMQSDLTDTNTKIDESTKKSGGFSVALGAASVAIGGAGLAIDSFVKSAIASASTLEDAQSSLAQTVKSTGDAIGLTTQQLEDLAQTEQDSSTFAKSTIESGEAVMATFTNIGAKVFPQATQAMLDVSQKMGTDLPTTAKTLGKALNDPVAGLSALTRIGVQFSTQQKDQIKQMVKTGDTAGAQAIIIGQLNDKFGGQAAAAADTFSGKQAQMNNSLTTLKETIGTSMIPAITQLVNEAMKIIGPLTDWISKNPQLATTLLGIAAVAMPLIGGVGTLATAINGVKTMFGGAKDAGDKLKTGSDDLKKSLADTGDAADADAAKTRAAADANTTLTESNEKVSIATDETSASLDGQSASMEGLTAAKETSVPATEEATIAQEGLDDAMDANPIGAVTLAIMGAVTAVTLIIQYWPQISAFFTQLWSYISTFFNNLVQFIQGIPQKIVSAMSAFGNAVWNGIQAVGRFFTNLPDTMAYGLGVGIKTLFNWSATAFTWATTEVPKIITQIGTFFIALPGDIWNWIVSGIANLTNWGTQMTTAGTTGATNVFNAIGNWFLKLPQNITTWIAQGIVNLASWGLKMEGAGITAATNVITDIGNFFEKLPGNIATGIATAVTDITTWGANMLAEGVKQATSFVTSVITEFETLPSQVYTIGQDIVTGIWNGISSLGSWLWKQLTGFVGNMISSFTKGLDSHSPSRVFANIGMSIPQGLAQGITGQQALVNSALNDMISKSSIDMSVKNASAMLAGGIAGNTYNNSSSSIDNSKNPVININGPINLTNKGSQAATLQQLQFLTEM